MESDFTQYFLRLIFVNAEGVEADVRSCSLSKLTFLSSEENASKMRRSLSVEVTFYANCKMYVGIDFSNILVEC